MNIQSRFFLLLFIIPQNSCCMQRESRLKRDALLLPFISHVRPSNTHVIIAPYQPRFLSRFIERLYPIGETLTAIVLGSLAINHLNIPSMCFASYQPEQYLCLISGMLIASFRAIAMRNRSLLDTLLINPYHVVFYNNILSDQFIEWSSHQCHDTITFALREQRFREQTDIFLRKSPVFLLGECTLSTCPLLRSCYSFKRAAFEGKVCDLLYQACQRIYTRPVDYISFGSGFMLQDLIILSKVLIQNPQARITIHMIDPIYTIFVRGRRLLNQSTLINPHSATNISPIFNELLRKTFSDELLSETPSYDEDPKNIYSSYKTTVSQGQQFITWLSNTFPKAQLLLYLYAKNINLSCTKYAKNYADVITSVDIDGPTDHLKGSIRNYIRLTTTALCHNPKSRNIMLSYTQKGSLKYIRNRKAEGFTENILEHKEQIITYYSKHQKIRKPTCC